MNDVDQSTPLKDTVKINPGCLGVSSFLLFIRIIFIKIKIY